MKSRFSFVCLLLAGLLTGSLFVPTGAVAQDSASFKAEFLRHFNTSARKFLALAEAMPAELYAWRPDNEAMSVEEVYMHIARYNYNHPHTYLDTTLPADVNLDAMASVTGKQNVLEHLRASVAYVKATTDELGAAGMNVSTRLYGRETEGWGVLFQLITHMNEHLGQSIAYARMNGVTPPWSR
ncbi:MAG: DinB family protein [Bacteroidota bacterium]